MDDFEQLAAQYSNMIHSIIHSLHVYKNHDEFYQIGLLGLWDASKNYDEQKAQFTTYAYSFIRGRMLTFLRKEKKWEDHCLYPKESYWDSLECESSMLEKETLLSHFYQLTDKQENWVLLRFYLGLSNQEIAKQEKVSLSAVKAWERLAFKKVIGKPEDGSPALSIF